MGPDGQVHLISRGESTELGKAFAVEYNEDLGQAPDATLAEVPASTFNSTIAGDEVMVKLAEKGILRLLQRPQFQ